MHFDILAAFKAAISSGKSFKITLAFPFLVKLSMIPGRTSKCTFAQCGHVIDANISIVILAFVSPIT